MESEAEGRVQPALAAETQEENYPGKHGFVRGGGQFEIGISN